MRNELLEKLDGSQEKVEETIEQGPEYERLLDALVTQAQLLSLRGEVAMDRGQGGQAEEDLAAARSLSEKLCDDTAAA
eukprot:CAMPEP_0172190822 /NCGR_PEP_ID=MMETSP1050-20130122/23334_1 /TAXON_ID=233186 /ORGANISM="Cryptomonas curvata, Strain CCAP979/52" /LENGTH=77 /DNA_ID=CAMNT_0012865753 /DNA_START=125 /DNA_END=354 /DNA_ORIENTATION=+